MRKLIGFILIWIAVGIIFMMCLPSKFCGVLLCVILFLVGYYLFKCDC